MQDASYFLGALRAKCTDVAGEIERMRAESQRIQRDGSAYAHMERTYETLIKDVRQLEGNLADHNLALDKARNGMDPQETEEYMLALKERNTRIAAQVDDVFVRRQQASCATGGGE